jgi:molecular chaperone DnaJ
MRVSTAAADYYELLGVPRGAATAEIKRAFRARARLLHPDVSDDPDAEERFRELADAYATLSTPASRLLYDRFGYRGAGAWIASQAQGRRAKVGAVGLGFDEAARGGRRAFGTRAAFPARPARPNRAPRATAAATGARPSSTPTFACSRS